MADEHETLEDWAARMLVDRRPPQPARRWFRTTSGAWIDPSVIVVVFDPMPTAGTFQVALATGFQTSLKTEDLASVCEVLGIPADPA